MIENMLTVYLQSWIESPYTRLIGVTSSSFLIVSLLFKSESNVKLGLSIGNLFASAHFFLLGSQVVGLISLIGAIRLWLSSKTQTKGSNAYNLAIFFTVFYFASFVVLFGHSVEFLGLLATLIGTWAALTLTGVHFRALLVVSLSLWLLFDLSMGAYEIALSSLLSLVAGLVALHREVKNVPRERSDKTI